MARTPVHDKGNLLGKHLVLLLQLTTQILNACKPVPEKNFRTRPRPEEGAKTSDTSTDHKSTKDADTLEVGATPEGSSAKDFKSGDSNQSQTQPSLSDSEKLLPSGGTSPTNRQNGLPEFPESSPLLASRPEILLDSIPYVGGNDGYKVYRAPTMVMSKMGTILAFSEGRVNGPADEDDMDVVLKRSVDGGKTWGKIQILVNDGRNPCKNQSPVVLPSGRILLLWLWNKWIPNEGQRTTRKIYSMYSDDDGITWSKPKDITETAQDASWEWTGLGPVHGIIKKLEPNKGRIIFPSRHNTADTNMVSHVIYSDDQGESWTIGASVSRPKTTESTVVELSNGDIMLNSRNQNDAESNRVASISKDGGRTFANTWLETQLIEPRGVQGSLIFHSFNSKSKLGTILFSNPDHATERANGKVKISRDDGKTWSAALTYAPKPAPYFTGYSDMVVLPDGDIGVLYERGEFNDSRDDKGDRYKEIGFTVLNYYRFKPLGP